MDNPTKQKVLSEFATMRLIEQDARDFYIRILENPAITDDKIRNCFAKIAADEEHHVELVDRIMNIVRNCL